MQAAARELPRDVRRAIEIAAANIRTIARRQLPRPWTSEPVRGVHITPARAAAGSRRLLCAWRTVSAPLLAPDDRHAGACRGRPRDRRGVPAPGRHHPARGPRGRRVTTVQAWRSAGHRGARVRDRDRSIRRQDRRTRQRVRRSGEGARLAGLRDRFLRRSERDRRGVLDRTTRMDRGRSHRAGRARSGRTGDPVDAFSAARGCGRAENFAARCRTKGPLPAP